MSEQATSHSDDWYVTVCASCLRSACWLGIFFCDEAQHANTTKRWASELRELGLEHEDYFSREQLLKHCGSLEGQR